MRSTCTITGCDRKSVSKGFCDKHYRRFSKYGDPLGLPKDRVYPGTYAKCSVDGCSRPHLTKGFCSLHAQRLRKHGDPLTVKIIVSRRGEPLEWVRGNINSETDECIVWPFRARYENGYGSMWFNGVLTGAHRVMCILAHGEPPSHDLHAAHSCANRLCVNPRHLRWATASENEIDKIAFGKGPRGVRNPQAKLSEDQVIAIMAMKGSQTQKEIAALFDVDRKTVSHIHSGKCWSHITSEIGGAK